MPEDTKKLETLSYEPADIVGSDGNGTNPENMECKCTACKLEEALEKPTNVPSAPLGFNSHVIKPETRVNKSESAGQPFEQPECEHNWEDRGICAQCTKCQVTNATREIMQLVREGKSKPEQPKT